MRAFFRSTIGRKVIMAVTGLGLIAFLISHMLSNLLVFQGPDKINEYAVFLRSLGWLLWAARAALLAAAVLHVWAAWSLTREARAARPAGYRKRDPQASTLGSRTMRWGGVLLLVFIVFHLLHFTFGSVHPDFIDLQPYHNVMVGFRNPLVVLFYVVALAFLGLHLYHGVWSSGRTLGVSPRSPRPLRRRIALLVAAALWLGFTIIPLAVLAGIVG
jgi:succinate dehydrogenase / fumarate reductase cytochrome b subunit